MLRGEWKERDQARKLQVKNEKEQNEELRSLGLETGETPVEGGNAEQDKAKEDDLMTALTEGLRTTSIGMVPRAVRRKQIHKEKSERMVME